MTGPRVRAPARRPGSLGRLPARGAAGIEARDVGEHLGHRLEEALGDLTPERSGLVEELRERRVLDDRHVVLARLLADALREVVAALGHHLRRGPNFGPFIAPALGDEVMKGNLPK